MEKERNLVGSEYSFHLLTGRGREGYNISLTEDYFLPGMNHLMTTRDKLEDDIRQSMRDRNQARLDALRFLKAAVQAAEKSGGEPLDDGRMLDVVSKQVNDRRESIRMFREGNRTDLVAKESAELLVLEEYLPPQMTREELESLINELVSQVGAASIRDKGKLMGRLMPQVKGKADGALVNELATQILESLS